MIYYSDKVFFYVGLPAQEGRIGIMRLIDWGINGFDRDTAVKFCREGINPLVSVFLASRGIVDHEAIQVILGKSPEELYDPFLLADMEKAVRRIHTAVEKGERIAVYGDYDVDGMTSCAILTLWLREKGADFEIYIPSRLEEGYSLNKPAIDMLRSHGVSLIITVDCGITSIEEAEYARSAGLGLVITDHHECKAQLPEADAVIDPKRPDCSYPNKLLAGVGVAFKLVCALERETSHDIMLQRYGDLVAIGTIADVMPVTGENRILIRRGLRDLNERPRLGFMNLLEENYIEHKKITTATVGFILAPRLNAAGRMGRTMLSVELLLTEDNAEAERLTAELNNLNTERRKLESEIFDEAIAMLPEQGPDGPIILAKRGWYQGVTGIVAAKMAERFLVPAIIISIGDDGTGRGSCRSIGKFGIYNALHSCEELLDNYGGHDMASGVTIAEENINLFSKHIRKLYQDSKESISTKGLRMDFEVEKPELLTIKNVEALETLEPFGNGNAPPLLCIRGALLTAVNSIGAGKHTRLKIEKAGRSLDCIYFAMPTGNLDVSEGMRVDIAFEPQINSFRGRSNVQLQVFDIKASG